MVHTSSLEAAYQVLKQSVIHYQGQPVGTIASNDPDAPAENYADCFVRDFVPSAFVFLLDGKAEIVRNFLNLVLKIRDMQEEMEGHQLLPRVMPASFKVVKSEKGGEELHADFGDRAIGRVAPVDSMMWWILILHAYTAATKDQEFARTEACQRGIRTILSICLRDRFEVFPTLLVPDGSFMIDRRMGVFGHPLEIQSLFFAALHAGIQMLDENDPANQPIVEQSTKRMELLTDYVRQYYWLDPERLNEIHRYQTELFGHESNNALNIYPESIPDWLTDWLPDDAGYMVGNIGPGRIDFRFFAFGNLLSAIYGLATPEQSKQIMSVFELRWSDLMGLMPVKICYPAMDGKEWHLLTGSDPKNIPWSYHNGGNWPTLLWGFTAAAINADRADLGHRAYQIASFRLERDYWPEYYDGRSGRLIGRRANYNQTWTAAALILSHKFLHEPDALDRLGLRPFNSGATA